MTLDKCRRIAAELSDPLSPDLHERDYSIEVEEEAIGDWAARAWVDGFCVATAQWQPTRDAALAVLGAALEAAVRVKRQAA